MCMFLTCRSRRWPKAVDVKADWLASRHPSYCRCRCDRCVCRDWLHYLQSDHRPVKKTIVLGHSVHITACGLLLLVNCMHPQSHVKCMDISPSYTLWFKKWTPTIFSNNFDKYWSMSVIFGTVNLLWVLSVVHMCSLKIWWNRVLGEVNSIAAIWRCVLKTGLVHYCNEAYSKWWNVQPFNVKM